LPLNGKELRGCWIPDDERPAAIPRPTIEADWTRRVTLFGDGEA